MNTVIYLGQEVKVGLRSICFRIGAGEAGSQAADIQQAAAQLAGLQAQLRSRSAARYV